MTGEDIIEHIELADSWAETSLAWPEDVVMEVNMAIQTIKYPDVGLLEHLLTLKT